MRSTSSRPNSASTSSRGRSERDGPRVQALTEELEPEHRPPAFPLAALWVAVAGILGGLFIASLLTIPVFLFEPENEPAAAATSMVGLFSGFALAGWFVSEHWGTGRVRDDFGLHFRGSDLWWGALVAAAALGAAVLLSQLVSYFPDLEGNNTDFVREQGKTAPGAVVVLLATTIGAPIFEELFFRGLILRTLRSRVAPIPAIGIQAAAFGLLHFQVGQGLGTLTVIVATGVLGVVFGTAAVIARRLGPGIIGHALFNGVVVVPLLLGS